MYCVEGKKSNFQKGFPIGAAPAGACRSATAVGGSWRYDCGSYQTIFAQIDYDCGETIYVTAAARTSDYDPIIALLQNVWPTGHAPENARTADKTTKAVTEEDVNGGRSKSLA